MFNDENADFIGNRVNIYKHKRVYYTIKEVQRYRNSVYQLKPVESIQQFLKSLKSYNEKNLHKYSLQIEPRNSEKDDLL